MRAPVATTKPKYVFPISDTHIFVYGYETDFSGKVVKASAHQINVNAPLSELRDKYAEQYNIFPHEIDMFYNDKEVFDDETCVSIGIRHEQIVRMHVTIDNLYRKDLEDDEFSDLEIIESPY